MKKYRTEIIIALLCPCCFALGWTCNEIKYKARGTATEQRELTFEDLLDAIEQEESGGDPTALCPDGCCVGAFQITKIYIDDCNRILKLFGSETRVSYEDRWNREISRDITAVVTCYYANRDSLTIEHDRMQFFETAARTHKSPSHRNHESTKPYWEKVKARMEKK